MKRIVIPVIFFAFLAGAFALSVKADSTITVPVPEKVLEGKSVTLSLRIPPNTEPLTKEKPPKLVSRTSTIFWDSNPSPKLAVNDEIHVVFAKFNDKGWVKGHAARGILSMNLLDKYYAIRVLDHIVDNILDIAQASNLTRVVRKINLSATDIEDLRRMTARFSKELGMFGKNMKKVDKDLLMLQEQIKKAKTGILKVIKVEGMGDGSTIIHMNVD